MNLQVINKVVYKEMKHLLTVLAFLLMINLLFTSSSDTKFTRKRRSSDQRDSRILCDGSNSNSCDNIDNIEFSRSDKTLVTEKPLEFFSNDSTKDCQCYSLDDEHAVRFAYLIILHDSRTIEDSLYAFRSIAAKNTIILIHIDNKLDWNIFLESSLYSEIETCTCGALVYIDQKYSPEWGEWSMNLPTIWAMDILTTHVQFRKNWDTFINISGDTIPTRTPNKMSHLFHVQNGPLSGMNFVTSSSCTTGLSPTHIYHFPRGWHKRNAHSTNPEGHPVVSYKDDTGVLQSTVIPTYFGSQWVILTYSFVEYLASSLRRNDSLVSKYRDALILMGRVMTDETFIPSLLMLVAPETIPQNHNNEKIDLPDGSSMTSVRYERMDEHAPSAFGEVVITQRYDVPEGSIATKPRLWGPYFLGIYDLGDIKREGSLFLRKASVFVEPNIVNMFPVDTMDELPDIYWPEEVKISEKPQW